MDYYDNSMELRKAINQIRDNFFSPTEPGAFQDIVNSLLYHDRCVVITNYGGLEPFDHLSHVRHGDLGIVSRPHNALRLVHKQSVSPRKRDSCGKTRRHPCASFVETFPFGVTLSLSYWN